MKSKSAYVASKSWKSALWVLAPAVLGAVATVLFQHPEWGPWAAVIGGGILAAIKLVWDKATHPAATP